MVEAVRRRGNDVCRPVVLFPSVISAFCLKKHNKELNTLIHLGSIRIAWTLHVWKHPCAFVDSLCHLFLILLRAATPLYTPREITGACRALEGIFVYVLERAKNISVPCETFWTLHVLFCQDGHRNTSDVTSWYAPEYYGRRPWFRVPFISRKAQSRDPLLSWIFFPEFLCWSMTSGDFQEHLTPAPPMRPNKVCFQIRTAEWY